MTLWAKNESNFVDNTTTEGSVLGLKFSVKEHRLHDSCWAKISPKKKNKPIEKDLTEENPAGMRTQELKTFALNFAHRSLKCYHF